MVDTNMGSGQWLEIPAGAQYKMGYEKVEMLFGTFAVD
jgi:hypothetical protein